MQTNEETVEDIVEGIVEENVDDSKTVVEEAETNESDENVAEELADAQVAKAAIESETQLELARINAELEKMRIKMEEKREKEWTATADELRAAISALTEKVEAMAKAGQSIPANLTEQVAELATEVSEAEAANNSTPQFMSPPINETKTEATLESGDGKQAKATVTTRKKRRMI